PDVSCAAHLTLAHPAHTGDMQVTTLVCLTTIGHDGKIVLSDVATEALYTAVGEKPNECGRRCNGKLPAAAVTHLQQLLDGWRTGPIAVANCQHVPAAPIRGIDATRAICCRAKRDRVATP